jgi:Ser-tRNA(Ala) deacylase AlaX
MTMTTFDYENLSTENLMQLVDSKREFIKEARDYNEKVLLQKEMEEVEKLLKMSLIIDEVKERRIRILSITETEMVMQTAAGELTYYFLAKCIGSKDGKMDLCEDLGAYLNSLSK